MQTLQIDGKKAKELFPSASKEFKQILIDSFGQKFFEQKITDRIQTFEDVCAILDIDPDDIEHAPHSKALEQDIISVNAYQRLILITRAYNEGWVPNWSDSNQRKWVPYFDMSSGFGFDGVVGWYASSGVGSRLCFKSEELARDAAKKFLSEYKVFFTIQS